MSISRQDLDAVMWADGRRCVPLDHHHRHPWPGVRRRYLAVDASLRRRFRWVLDAHYNAAHRDHFHADLGGLPSARAALVDEAGRSAPDRW